MGMEGVSLSEEASSLNEIMFGSCRKKVDTNFVLELVLNVEETCKASDFEKRMAANVFNSILSILTHYRISDVSYKNYTMGGSLGWFETLEKPDVNYQKWADSNNFSLGDFLSNVWSDKWTSKYGRRQPFILAGSLMISVAGPACALLADLSGPDQHNSSKVICCLRMAVGNILGFSAGASGSWHRACYKACANLKAAFLVTRTVQKMALKMVADRKMGGVAEVESPRKFGMAFRLNLVIDTGLRISISSPRYRYPNLNALKEKGEY
ncbi:Detected protein of confused Function [Hibiscus syriacus]|uniref:Detected protein of confused Function n=1 Tax=Hibiscus syriacus TaxID=106335 RepID=A0A6A2ZXT4_HIBSY|nr:Detected protein of confused Function [Hibiscus syriacus]